MEKKIKKLSDIYSDIVNVEELFSGVMQKVKGGCFCMVVGGGGNDENKGSAGKAGESAEEKAKRMYEELCELEGETPQ